ncbi:hypothetical protein LTR64_003691 [Lithohypha guttulata]|uniref:uncharacterized protein n=1 Tax=Lithohypha guttulata TaxID=1690604 RepID=UPI002DDE1F5F|nr:hypothetical protein LTR51_000089 [Lithohypha guttulata]
MQLIARFRNQYEKTRQQVKTTVKGLGNKLTKRVSHVETYKNEECKVRQVADTDHTEWSINFENTPEDTLSFEEQIHAALAIVANDKRDGSGSSEGTNLEGIKNKEEDIVIRGLQPSDLLAHAILLEPAYSQVTEIVTADKSSSSTESKQDSNEEEDEQRSESSSFTNSYGISNQEEMVYKNEFDFHVVLEEHTGVTVNDYDKDFVTQKEVNCPPGPIPGGAQVIAAMVTGLPPVAIKNESEHEPTGNDREAGQREQIGRKDAADDASLASNSADDVSDVRHPISARRTSAEAICDAEDEPTIHDPICVNRAQSRDEATQTASPQAEADVNIEPDPQIEVGIEEDEEDYSDDDSDFPRFEEVYNAIDLEALKTIALSLRKHVLVDSSQSAEDLSCVVHEDTKCGSYNVAFLVMFSDDVQWVAKVPGYGKNPSELQKEKMESEYRTAQYVRSKTTFKMPEIYLWTTDPSVIGVAFGLMSYMNGTSLWHCWQNPYFDYQRCLRAVGDVAKEMAKLYCLQFPKTGMLRFDNDRFTGVDYEIEYEEAGDCNWANSRKFGPFASTTDWIQKTIARIKIPPYKIREKTKDYRHPTGDKTLRTMLESVPQFMQESPLSLCLADPDFQNIFVDFETGELQGFIDMDNLHVTPVVVGSAAFPPIITRDRNMGKFVEEARVDDFHHSQAGLDGYKKYRRHYAACFKAALPQDTKYDPRWTELSHHLYYLEYASWTHREWGARIIHQMSRDAYKHVYGDKLSDERLGDLRKADMSSLNPYRRRRFVKTIAKGLWIPEDESTSTVSSIVLHSLPQESAPSALRPPSLQNRQVCEDETQPDDRNPTPAPSTSLCSSSAIERAVPATPATASDLRAENPPLQQDSRHTQTTTNLDQAHTHEEAAEPRQSSSKKLQVLQFRDKSRERLRTMSRRRIVNGFQQTVEDIWTCGCRMLPSKLFD